MAESPNVGWASFFAHHFTARREFLGNKDMGFGVRKKRFWWMKRWAKFVLFSVGKKACPPYLTA